MSAETAVPTTELYLRGLCLATFTVPFIAQGLFDIRKTTRPYGTRVTPPPRFFAIWGLIYLNFLIASAYAIINDTWQPTSWMLFAAWNVAAGLWTYSISHLSKIHVIISTALILGQLCIMEALWIDLVTTPSLTGFAGLYAHNTFALCVGWLIAACNISVGSFMILILGVSYNAQMVLFWLHTPIVYGLFYYYNLTTAPIASSYALFPITAYALVGAVISSRK